LQYTTHSYVAKNGDDAVHGTYPKPRDRSEGSQYTCTVADPGGPGDGLAPSGHIDGHD